MKSVKTWTRHVLKSSLAVVAVVGGSAALSACGSGGGNTGFIQGQLYPNGPFLNCTSGQFTIAGTCVSGRSFEEACRNLNPFNPAGAFINSNGHCQVTRSTSTGSGMARLTPSIQNYATTIPIPVSPYYVEVKPNYKVTWSASGSWGSNSTSEKIWGIFTVTSCNAVNLSGMHDGVQRENEGLPAGLLGLDGNEVFFAGPSGTRVIEQGGALRFGLNIPFESWACGSFRFSSLKVVSCEDAQGNSYPCP